MIKDKKIPFSIIIILLPIFAFASGGEVLSLFYSIGISVIFFFIALIVLKLRYSEKFILTTVYILTLFLLFYLTSDIPYRDNMNTINLYFGLIPIGTCLITFLILRLRKMTIKN